MKNLIHAIIGAVVAFIAVNVAQRWRAIQTFDGHLSPAEIAPGPWYAYYMGDYMVAFDTDEIHSAIVELKDGTYMWATQTPEWDRDWFEEHLGWEFPEKWVPYTDLAAHNLPATELG